jgi:hypothetical protein
MLKHPAAFLPLLFSLLAIATVAIHVARFGTARQADEGTAAHIWQLLMVAQVLLIAFFAIRWLPQEPRPAIVVLALQAAGVIAALAPVYLLGF